MLFTFNLYRSTSVAQTLSDLINEAFGSVEGAHWCINNSNENPKGVDINGRLGTALNLLKTASNLLDRDKSLDVDVLQEDIECNTN